MNALVNAGVLVSAAIGFSTMGKESGYQTTVEIGAGDGPGGNPGGGLPHISLWNEKGERLGQHMPKGSEKKVPPGMSTKKPIVIDMDQGALGKPEYLLLTTINDDALCITHVTVAGGGAFWSWMGDVAYTCGGDWYPSKSKVGSDNYMPKCGWIDANHSDDLRFIAMSMHMPDFNTDEALLAEYNNHPANLCDSKARFMLWGELGVTPGYDMTPPMFNPPLEYRPNGADKDFAALFKPGRVHEKRDITPGTHSPRNMTGKIDMPGHVVVSNFRAHRAEELCESETSRGPSFVSTHDGMYCDMSTKTAHHLCSAERTAHCFDLDTHELVGENRRLHQRDLSKREVHKRYVSHEVWDPTD